MPEEKSNRDMNVAPTGGLRDNKGKPRLALVPCELEEAVAEVIFKSSTEGGGKYPMNNWKKGLPFTQVAESALRHIKKFAVQVEDLDTETGLHHLAHAACNIAFLLWYLKNRPEMDDRKGQLQKDLGTGGTAMPESIKDFIAKQSLGDSKRS